MNVRLDDKSKTLHAGVQMVYHNNSPDTLHEIWFHLWPNAYRDNSTALVKQQLKNGVSTLYFAEDDKRGYIDSLDFRIYGSEVKWEYHPQHKDICRLIPASPVLPGDSVLITTPFFVKLPSAKFSRLGHNGDAYAITQWYPKPAVYDNDGWHPMPYLDQGEFYSEFGSYTVSITLPSNYVVGATGELITHSEILWLNSKADETLRNFPVDKDLTFPVSSDEEKTITYKGNNIHDFAWFADKRYHVLKGNVKLGSGRDVTTWSMFTSNELPLWKNSLEYIHDGIEFYSKHIGEYPYPECTVVDGTITAGTGMEYPGVTVIGESRIPLILEITIVHEIGHNWFYGILASNERKNPWMDEGINSFYEMRYITEKYGNSPGVNEMQVMGKAFKVTGADKMNIKQAVDLYYKISESVSDDQPVYGPAEEFSSLNYGTIVYKKTALAFDHLHNYLGDVKFDKSMKAYFDTWKFRHPSPADLRTVLESQSNENLSWFFDTLLATNIKTDYSIRSIKKPEPGKVQVKLKNKSGNEVKVPVYAFSDNRTVSKQWISFRKKSEITMDCPDCDSVIIDPFLETLDYNRFNNNSRINGILKKRDRISISMFPKLDYPTARRAFILPAGGWNVYDGFMIGPVVSNSFFPVRKFEFDLAPFYAFNSKNLTGTGSVRYNYFPENGFARRYTLGISARTFAYEDVRYRNSGNQFTERQSTYLRMNPFLELRLRNKDFTSSVRQLIRFDMIGLNKEDVDFNNYINDSTRYGKIIDVTEEFYRLNYFYTNNRTLDPYSFKLSGETHKEFSKISGEFNYRFSYKSSKKGLDIRLFAGTMLNDDESSPYGFSLSDRNGPGNTNDYSFDNLYFGRTESEGIWSQQFALKHGAFRVFSPLGANRQWIAAMNISSTIPGSLPLRLYADFGTFNEAKSQLKDIFDINSSIVYNAGIVLELGFMSINFPLIKSKDIREYQELNEINFMEQISFVLNLQALNPVTLRNQAANY